MNYFSRLILFINIILFVAVTFSANGQCLEADSSSDINVDMPKPAEWLADHGFDTTNTAEILNVLEEGSLVESVYSAEFFAERGYEKAIEPILKRYKRIDNKGQLALSLVESLNKLKYENVTGVLEEYSEELFKDLPSNNLAYKSAVGLLFKAGEYSQLDNIIKIIKQNIDSEEKDVGYLYTLTCAFNSVQHKDRVINTLVFILQNYQDSEHRKMVAYYSKELPKSEKLKKAIKEAALNDQDYEVRDLALRSLLNTYRDNSTLDIALKNISRTRSPEEVENYINILYNFYTPKSLFLIKDLKDESHSNLAREKATEIYNDYWWLYFEPYGKAFDYPVSQSIDSLKAHTRDVASYGWLGNQGFTNELSNRLDNAGRHLARVDSANAAKQIANYQKRLQQVYDKKGKGKKKGRFITEDGYKFLSKNAAYLLDQLPDHPSENNGKEE